VYPKQFCRVQFAAKTTSSRAQRCSLFSCQVFQKKRNAISKGFSIPATGNPCFGNKKALAAGTRTRQARGALTFSEPMLFENRKAPAGAMRRLSFEASLVQTNTRDQESRANPSCATRLYPIIRAGTKNAGFGALKARSECGDAILTSRMVELRVGCQEL